MKQKHFLSILDFTRKEIFHLLQSALAFKKEPIEDRFARKLLVSLYEKQSLRTRLSFERAMSDLGGAYTYYSINPNKAVEGADESVHGYMGFYGM